MDKAIGSHATLRARIDRFFRVDPQVREGQVLRSTNPAEEENFSCRVLTEASNTVAGTPLPYRRFSVPFVRVRLAVSQGLLRLKSFLDAE